MCSLNGDFIDILEDRRRTSDIGWALKTWNVPPCRYSLRRTPEDIKKHVLSSEKIKSVIKQVSNEKGCTEEEIEEEARNIIDEMAHNFQFRVIRFFGYVLSKFMKSVYGRIFVNKKGMEKIANISNQYPILFLPTHRSYADFLLVSYVCFYFNLPLPVIAAGLDFLGLKFLSFLLRGAGAFFIRRSFVGDRLYRELFSEYVQTHIEGCEFPIEFFIEGTRSRSAKSLVPKLGMMQVILDMYFSSKVPDIIIIPISISYDRTLEEMLYAYELLGVPKPKESTKGLIKARKVMSDFYGDVYVRFGEQISLRDYFRSYDRSVHNLHPRDLSVIYEKEHLLCRDLANHVIRMHQCNLLLSPFPLMCLVISQPTTARTGVHIDVLSDYVYWLDELIKRSGATICATGETLTESLIQNIQCHSNIVEMNSNLLVSFKDVLVQSSASTVPRLNDNTVRYAIPAMLGYHYGNQALQLLVHVSMISLAMTCSGSVISSQESVFHRYKTLRKLLQREFVFERETDEKDFMHALRSLKEENIISVEDSSLAPLSSATDKFEFLSSLLLTFLESYYIICQYLAQSDQEHHPPVKKLSLQCQSYIENALLQGSLSDYRCLSLDIVNNCLTYLVNQGALLSISKDGQSVMFLNFPKITNILLDLEVFLPAFSRNNQNGRLSLPAAKL
ncbi:dihydroxyacetone phosphate acyltransferase-like [Argiope bruennichi]|uniref:dihydroxyacetone phosphate acyltransferase-like n=1 Tax=Argiope bruennichi TaxID=94029 RepID=UPI00249514C3|nr:dihydroxyacetone phosphate acyltransferase-like [Argiope bruennichi]XP_055953386.1 dihydroxyacetone phosphate acyltransferase-like [Argiope bruennichi]